MQLFLDDGSHQHQSERSACRSYDYDDEGNPVKSIHLSDFTILSYFYLGPVQCAQNVLNEATKID